jgi:ATP-dependent RNA helicase DeaD
VTSATDEPDGGSFADLGLRDELLTALTGLGYEEPTPIQREAVPTLIAGRDLQGQAATGTGKTAAFALPILQRMPPGRRESAPFALVLVPTRELAIQVSEALYRYGKELGARVVPVYGGQPIGRQLRALDAGVDVVVATPGRALDHLQRGTLQLGGVATVVLDESDEMLDMGFAEDIEAILDETPDERQTVLFSATMPRRLDSLARRYLRDPVRIQVARASAEPGVAPQVRQTAYVVQHPAERRGLGRARSAGCWTSRRPPRRSCSAAPATRWTRSPRRSTPAATAPRRCTAG